MIDFHSHILPNIDDGSRSLNETIYMIEEAKKAGFTKIICIFSDCLHLFLADSYGV